MKIKNLHWLFSCSKLIISFTFAFLNLNTGKLKRINMWLVIKENKYFFISYAIFLIFGLIIQLQYSQADIFLFVNLHYYLFGDFLFPHWTSLGDGLFSVFVVLFLLFFISYKDALIAAIVFLISSAIAQYLKNYIFPLNPRPQPFFLNLHENIHIIKGVVIHQYNSFPSGHSTSAFAVFCVLALIWEKKQWGWLFFIIALSVGYSRMYLAQHFFLDIYVGSIIGVLCALFFYWIFKNVKAREWHYKAIFKKNL